MKKDRLENKRESGMPGGGAGRTDEVGHSGVYTVSGPHPAGDAPIVPLPSWGQGSRGAQGYQDAGESELIFDKVTPEKCRDLMTKDPLCCLPRDSCELAAQVMKHHNIGVVPVVSDNASKKLVGMVTDRDLALKVVAEGLDPKATPLEKVMTSQLFICSPDDDIPKALDLMAVHKLRRIPAVDQNGRIVGVISQADVALRLRRSADTAMLTEELSRPSVH